MAAQTVDRLADFGLAPVEACLFGRSERLHTGIGACWGREGYTRPLLLQLDQARVSRVDGQRRRQQPVKPHALVSQRPQRHIVADIVQVASLHRHNRVQADADILVKPCAQQLPQLIQ